MQIIPTHPDEVIWAQKYRPNTIDNVILPDRIKEEIKSAIEKDSVQNMLLHGEAGTGKTTVAKAIINDLDASSIFINASLETSIDMLRSKVVEFVTSKAVFHNNSRKVVLLDEAEQLSLNALNALKSLFEQFSKNALFIMTTNHINKIPEPIQSRMNVIKFEINPDEKQDIAKQIFEMGCSILDNEGIEYDSKVVAKALKLAFPDNRKFINLLQKGSQTGILKSEILLDDGDYTTLIEHINNKKWNDMRQWVADNYHIFDFHNFYLEISKHLKETQEIQKLPEIVILTSQYDYKQAFVTDKEVNITAFLTEIMSV